MNYLVVDKNRSITNSIRDITNCEIITIDPTEFYTNFAQIILETKPQLVFIDLDTNIDYYKLLFDLEVTLESKPYFIGLSKFKIKAYDAFKYHFSDFLLKPLIPVDVLKCISKYKKNHPQEADTICIKSYRDYQYIAINDILYLKADNNTTDFYLIDGSVVGAYKTMKVFERTLPKTFLRIHKSYIVNNKHISRINYGKSICVVQKSYRIPFTKTFIANVNAINALLSKNTTSLN